MSSYNVPEVDWDAIVSMLNWERGLQSDRAKQRNNQQQTAMRWQGQQDYETLVKSGVDPMESLRRAAPKLFFNDPKGMAEAIRSISKPKPTQGAIETIGGEQFIRQPTGHLIQVNTAKNRPEERTVTVSTPIPGDSSGARATMRLTPTEFSERNKQAEQGKLQEAYDAAVKGSKNWFGGSANKAAAITSSNALANTFGINAQTGKPIGATQGTQPQAITKEQMEAAFGGSTRAMPQPGTTAAPVAPGGSSRPTPSQAQAAFNAITPPVQSRGGAIPSQAAPTNAPAYPPAPPKEQRQSGKIYMRPAGPHIWRGTGWEPVTSATTSSITSENFAPPQDSYTGTPLWAKPGYEVIGMAGTRM